MKDESGVNDESKGLKFGRLLRNLARKLLHYTLEALKRIGIFAVGFIMIGGAVYWVGEGLDYATKLHWLAGLILSVITVIVLLWLIRWLWRQPLTHKAFGYYPLQGLVLNLALVVWAAIVAMATISNILYEAGFIQYTSSGPITSDRLLNYYGWHFVDSIPILKIWSIFDIDTPLKGEGLWPGVLVMVFRVAIIAPIVALVKKHLGRREKTNPSAAVELRL